MRKQISTVIIISDKIKIIQQQTYALTEHNSIIIILIFKVNSILATDLQISHILNKLNWKERGRLVLI